MIKKTISYKKIILYAGLSYLERKISWLCYNVLSRDSQREGEGEGRGEGGSAWVISLYPHQCKGEKEREGEGGDDR